MQDYAGIPSDRYRAGGVEGLAVSADEFPSDFQSHVTQIEQATERVIAMRKELYRKVVQLSGDFPMQGRDAPPEVKGMKSPIIVQQRHALKDLYAELDELAAVINHATSI